ncbi:MAG: glycoside hydrolase family 5 protein [Candidatus Marinimicrobia bacterium]|nr:glycoside hydrolase family 5 protein [Candidatus Neomarinimicrobiota bacterium]
MHFALQAASPAGWREAPVVFWNNGWVTPEAAGDEGRVRYNGGCRINRYRWTRIGFGFTPAADGGVTVRLRAPATPGQPPVALRRLEAAGTRVENPHFDEREPGGLSGWTWLGEPGAVRPAGLGASASGEIEVQLVSGAGLEQRIPVTAGVPVRISLFARALTPPGYEEMVRLPAQGTAAHDALRHFRRGINLGNYLEAPPGEDWGAQYTAADFDAIRQEGFDHVRIPCAWHHHLGPAPDFQVRAAFYEQVDGLVEAAHERGLAVILNWHHFDAFTDAPDEHLEVFETVWVAIAARYAARPGRIAFELLNEPRAAATTEVMNRVYARVLPAIRAVAPHHPILVGPGRWNRIAELPALRLPTDDDNLIVTVHDYEPFLFTHQGAEWTGPATATVGLSFPGPPARPVAPDPAALAQADWVAAWFRAYQILEEPCNPCGAAALSENLRLAAAWAAYYGRPVHVGEWGCIASADPVSRAAYLRHKRLALDEIGLPWALWDWSARFAYWDRETARPHDGLRAALGLEGAAP